MQSNTPAQLETYAPQWPGHAVGGPARATERAGHLPPVASDTLLARGFLRTPLPPGNPAQQTSGRTLDHVARVYDLLEPLMMFGMDRTIRQEAVRLLSATGCERVLDVGCGTGVLTREIASALPCTNRAFVVGVDAATKMIAVAQRNAAGLPNLAFVSVLAEQLPFADETFDCAVSTMFFHHINAGLKARALNEIWRTLKPGGKVIVADVMPPTNLFGKFCAWAGYLLFQQAEIRENIEGCLEKTFSSSRFRHWRTVARHAGYVAVYELEK